MGLKAFLSNPIGKRYFFLVLVKEIGRDVAWLVLGIILAEANYISNSTSALASLSANQLVLISRAIVISSVGVMILLIGNSHLRRYITKFETAYEKELEELGV